MQPETPRAVRDIFLTVPATYETINHILTFGLDILWRKRAAGMAAAGGGTYWADMCTGTGETAALLKRLAPSTTTVFAVDFSLPMLGTARRKSAAAGIAFVAGDIGALPFPDESLDLITMSFAARNINLNRDSLVRSFTEFHRVLKRGGRFVNVETSRPPNGLVAWLRDRYVKLFVEFIGSRLSGARAAYAYLAHTIPRFYPAEELADIFRDAGFGNVSFQRHFFGVTAIHEGVKP